MFLKEPLTGRSTGMRVVENSPQEKGILGRVRGVFSQCDRKNKNGRVYERALWERVMKKYNGALHDRTLLGEADHPETRTHSTIQNASHTVTDMVLDDEGDLRGEVAIFNNPLGRTVWPMLEAGVKLGFSTRGDGDLVEDEKNGAQKVDPETYEFHGVDFVVNPSFIDAIPEAITEATKKKVRVALTEAVEKKQIVDHTKKEIEAILESDRKEEVEKQDPPVETKPSDAPKPNTKALEAALAQLRDAKVELSESQASVESLRKENTDLAVSIDRFKKLSGSRIDAVTRKLEASSAKVKKLAAQLQEQKAASELSVTGLKETMESNQNSHLGLVQRHRDLLSEKEVLGKRYEKALALIESLRARVVEAEEKAKNAEAKAEKAETSLREQVDRAPDDIRNGQLVQYKALKTEGLELSADLKQLLERAQTEEQVDALIETVYSSQAARYSFLPMGADSRAERERIAESISDESKEEQPDYDEEEARDQMKALERQLRS